ncbi:MAG: hypothetical protein ACOX21_00665 [Bacillota bacterium]
MNAFLLELKSISKNFRFVALMFILLCLLAMVFSSAVSEQPVQHQRTLRANNRYEFSNREWVEFWQGHYRYLEEHGVPRSIYSPETITYDLKWYSYEYQLAQEISAAYEAKDWVKYNQGLAKKTLLSWKLYSIWLSGMSNENIERLNLDKYRITPEEYYGEDWANYSKVLEIPDLDKLPWYYNRRMSFSQDRTVFNTTFYLYMAEKNRPPTGSWDTSPWAFTFNFLRRGLPKILGIIVLLISVNLIHRDRGSGSIKTTLQMPKNRRGYLLRKIGLSFTASTLIILLPLLLTFILLGIRHGFAGFDTPVLLTKNFLNLFLTSDEIYELRDFPTISAIGLSRYTVSWLSGRNLLESMEFIPLWQFLILAAILLALFILFCTAIAQLISIVFKNEIFAQVIALCTFVLGDSFSRIFPKLKTSPLDLFAMADVIPILEGSHCSTYLASILALALATVLLFVLSDRIFQRQDIS